jgi:hypothetical protein
LWRRTLVARRIQRRSHQLRPREKGRRQAADERLIDRQRVVRETTIPAAAGRDLPHNSIAQHGVGGAYNLGVM